jgi:glucose/arabinose dehydrogenase
MASGGRAGAAGRSIVRGRRRILVGVVSGVVVAVAAVGIGGRSLGWFGGSRSGCDDPSAQQTVNPPQAGPAPEVNLPASGVRTIATGLCAPWDLAFLPDGTALVTERDTTRILPARDFHQGGRIAFGPDGMLYVTVGDTYEQPHLAQDRSSLAGKILRITPEGKPARATRSPARRSGAWATATSKAWPGTPKGACTPASSVKTAATSST